MAAWVLYSCFIVSGALGLIYEVIWEKYLSLFIGATSYSQSIVLGTFMGGLALGAFLFGRMADKNIRKLSIYGWLEIAIGLYCVLFPALFDLYAGVWVKLATSLNFSPVAVLLLKTLLAIMLVLVPTTLMGGTLPALTKFFVSGLKDVRVGVATLYALNSLGGVVGIILAGFYMIKTYGLPVSITIAAVVNVFIGLTALVVRQFVEKTVNFSIQTGDGSKAETGEAGEGMVFPARIVKITFLAAGLTGMAAMIYEIAWIRLLALVQGSSTYTFSLMLIAFILGITLGSFIVRRYFHADAGNYRQAGIIELLIVISLMVTLPFYERIPYYFSNMASLFVRRPEAFTLYQLFCLSVCIAIMIVPTTLMGMVLPLLSRVASTNVKVLGKSVGSIFAINTIGTLAGALLGGLVLLPAIGLQNTFNVAMVISLAIGAVIIFSEAGTQKKLVVVTAVITAGFVVFLAIGAQWTKEMLVTGSYRTPVFFKSYGDYRKDKAEDRVIYSKDGSDCTVAVTETIFAQGAHHTLFLNGKADASSYGDLPTQLLSGHIPKLIKPEIKEVLIVGLGSGGTAGAVLQHKGVKVDLIEISPEVAEAARLFSDINNNVLDNPDFHLYIEDAKTFLKINNKKYDLILSEPTNIWISGMSKLFSDEFYTEIESHLVPGGLVVQWLHAYDMDDKGISLILRTFYKHFPHVEVWNTENQDYLLIGARDEFKMDLDRAKTEFEIPGVKANIARVGITEFSTLLSLQIIPQGGMKMLLPDIGVNDVVYSDYHPTIEYSAPKLFFTHSESTLFEINDWKKRLDAEADNLYISNWIAKHPMTSKHYADFISYAKERLPK
ncbi:MAG: fused MFS/spermidine synthase, partial [Myxococcota bacterium]